MKTFGRTCRWALAAVLVMSAVAVRPAVAQSTDEAVRAAVAAGSSTRVIMQFATTAARDAAFNRLLDAGAAVRATETEVGPALVVIGRAAVLASEFGGATQVSADASVTVLSTAPAHARSPRRSAARTSIREAKSYSGPAVAIIDSGIQPHADLPLSRIRMFKDFVAGGRSPVDGCGHGTHVAGIVAGSGAASDGVYAGIAPGVDVVALRVLGDDCSGRTSDVIDALEWVARNHATYKIRVVNLSLGHAVLESIFTDPLVQAVERLSRRGVVVVTAAGNKGINPKTGMPGYGGVGVPCNAPSSVCVGSLNTQGTPSFGDDAVANSSSRGPTRFDFLAKPDLVAPGVNIVSLAAPGSLLFENYPLLRVKDASGQDGYFNLSGTSMASPAVAGAAIRLLQANRGLSANAVKMALQFTSRILKKTDVLTQGAGALNMAGAVKLAKAIDPSAPLGSGWLRANVTPWNLDANDQRINWGQRIIYGDRFMQPRYAGIHLFRWSDDIVWAYDAIADNIVWGNNGDNIVWGNDDNIVWGNEDNIVWGNDDNIVWGNLEDDNIVWGNDESDNIVWGIDDNIVWGNDDNIVWGNTDDDNIVWGNGYVREVWAANIVWGFWDDNIVWGNVSRDEADNIVWGNDDNIVWGNCSMGLDDNIVWGNDDNIVWGNNDNNNDNIVWGNGCSRLKASDDNIVWGNRVLTEGVR